MHAGVPPRRFADCLNDETVGNFRPCRRLCQESPGKPFALDIAEHRVTILTPGCCWPGENGRGPASALPKNRSKAFWSVALLGCPFHS